MSTQDHYIDARLSGIEQKLDARMEAMQRFQDQAEARNAKAEERFERITQQLHADIQETRADMAKESGSTRRHSTHVAIGTVAGVIGAVGLSLAVAVSWIGDQSAWLRDSVNRIEQRMEAQPAPAPQAQIEPESPAADESGS